jgi:hypothetical protein
VKVCTDSGQSVVKGRGNVLVSKVRWKFRCGIELWKIFAGYLSQREGGGGEGRGREGERERAVVTSVGERERKTTSDREGGR